jgi:hypothetical protein
MILGYEDRVSFVKSLRMRWLGHVEILNNNRIPKMILNVNMEEGEDVQGSDGLTTSNVTLNV